MEERLTVPSEEGALQEAIAMTSERGKLLLKEDYSW